MFVEKLTNEELNAIVKRLLSMVVDSEKAKYYFQVGKLERYENSVSFCFDTPYDAGVCSINDWKAKLSLESKRCDYEDDFLYERFMYEKFGQEYIDALTKHLLQPIEYHYHNECRRIKNYICEVTQADELKR